MRVLVLVHEELVPPASIKGMKDQQIIPFKTEYDVTTCLEDLGHDVRPCGVSNDLGVLRDALAEFKPRIVVNVLEEFYDNALFEPHIVSYLELKRQRYTGCNPRGLMLGHDKALSKKILRYHGIPVPDFAEFPRGERFRVPKGIEFPLFVKSQTLDGSEGISQASICRNTAQLRERVRYVHRELESDAIAEEYIDGRELYVGVMGNGKLEVLPIWELKFRKAGNRPRIATSKVKWSARYQKDAKVGAGKATRIRDELRGRIEEACRGVYRALGLTGYARIDLRLKRDGSFYVLEANPNPDLVYGGELANSAEAAGISYEEFVDRILRLGLSYRA